MATGAPTPREPIAFSMTEDFDQSPFILSAEALQKIRDIIFARLLGKLLFDVAYNDGSKISDMSLERLLQDENPPRRSITSIESNFLSDGAVLDADRVRLSFDAADTIRVVHLSVSSPDRDRVWLMVEELRDYVSYNVVKRPRLPTWLKGLAILVVGGACSWGLILWGHIPPVEQHPSLAEVIQSTDPNVKLNYLLRGPQSSGLEISGKSILALIGVMFVFLLAFVNQMAFGSILRNSVFPRCHITIGQGNERYQKQVRLQRNLLWVVGVGLAISALGSLLAALFIMKPS